LSLKNIEFLTEIANYRKGSLDDMKQYLNGMDWANKTSPVKEIKYEEDEIEDLNETGFDELDLELQKFNKEKEEYK